MICWDFFFPAYSQIRGLHTIPALNPVRYLWRYKVIEFEITYVFAIVKSTRSCQLRCFLCSAPMAQRDLEDETRQECQRNGAHEITHIMACIRRVARRCFGQIFIEVDIPPLEWLVGEIIRRLTVCAK